MEHPSGPCSSLEAYCLRLLLPRRTGCRQCTCSGPVPWLAGAGAAQRALQLCAAFLPLPGRCAAWPDGLAWAAQGGSTKGNPHPQRMPGAHQILQITGARGGHFGAAVDTQGRVLTFGAGKPSLSSALIPSPRMLGFQRPACAPACGCAVKQQPPGSTRLAATGAQPQRACTEACPGPKQHSQPQAVLHLLCTRAGCTPVAVTSC